MSTKTFSVTFYISETGELLSKRKIKGYRSYEKVSYPFGKNVFVCMIGGLIENIDCDLENINISDYDVILQYLISVEPILMSKLDMKNNSLTFYNNTQYCAEILHKYEELFKERIDDSSCLYFATEGYDDDIQTFKTLDEFRLQINYVLSSKNLVVGVADDNKEICNIHTHSGENPYLTLYSTAYTGDKVGMFIDMFNNMY